MLSAQNKAVAGKLAFGLGNLGDARGYYREAQDLAKEAGNSQLYAYILGQRSHLRSPLFEAPNADSTAALVILNEAVAIADGRSQPLLYAWLLVRRAEEHANRHDSLACSLDLREAEPFLARPIGRGEGFLAHWKSAPGARLAGYQGSCARLLGRSMDAIPAIEAALKEISPSWISVRSSVLGDLAAAYALRNRPGDVDQSCALLNDSLDLASGARLGIYVRRVAGVRKLLDWAAAARSVRQLDERLHELLW
jgi:hypothetical protein